MFKEQEVIIENKMPELGTATELTAAGFVRPLSDELRRDVADHLSGDFVLSAEVEGVTCAYSVFSVYRLGSGAVLHADGVMVGPELQGMGVGEKMIEHAQDQVGAEYFAFRTQSPRMYRLGQKMTQTLFPRAIELADIPADIHEIGVELGKRMGQEFPFQPGCYGGEPLYGELPTHPDQSVLELMCDQQNGDAILCIGKFKE